MTCMQAEDPSALPAGSAHELEEDDTGTHANAHNAYIGRDEPSVDSLNRHGDMRHVRRQRAGAEHFIHPNRWKLV
jgi:hypothetical protein